MIDSISLNEKNINIDRIFPIRNKLDKVGYDRIYYRLLSNGIQL